MVDYCRLAFLEESGLNLTPEELPAAEVRPLLAGSDAHLQRVNELLQPEWLIGIGDFAETRARQAIAGTRPRIAKILHPSPAWPAVNRDWAGQVTRQLTTLGVWM